MWGTGLCVGARRGWDIRFDSGNVIGLEALTWDSGWNTQGTAPGDGVDMLVMEK